MKELDLENIIKEVADNATESVNPKLWDRLEMKLENHEHKQKTKKYKFLSFAAAVLAIFCVTGFVYNQCHSYNPDLIAYSDDHHLVLEDLEAIDNDFYDVEQINLLTSAYDKMASNQIK